MHALAWQNLIREPIRLAISVAGIGVSVALILLLQGFMTGMFQQITAYVDQSPAEYYVGERGVANLQGNSSRIPLEAVEQVRNTPGVTAAWPLLAQYAILELAEEKVTIFVLGYDPEQGGGPAELHRGREVRGPGEVVLDRILAQSHGIEVGDALEMLGASLRVVGLSERTASWMLGLVFVHHDEAQTLLAAPESTSFVLAAAAPDGHTYSRLERSLDGYTVLSREALADNDRDYLGGIFSAPIRLMVAVGVAVGALLAGLTIYTMTVERMREYGVLKAVGMGNRRLYGVVGRQAAMVAALGMAAGVLLVLAAKGLIEGVWPQFLVSLTGQSLLVAGGATGLMAAFASLLPAWFLGRLDPARVFRS